MTCPNGLATRERAERPMARRAVDAHTRRVEDERVPLDLDHAVTVVPVLGPGEVALLDQLAAAGRHITGLELRVNHLERELIALRAQREELRAELELYRAFLNLDAP